MLTESLENYNWDSYFSFLNSNAKFASDRMRVEYLQEMFPRLSRTECKTVVTRWKVKTGVA